TYTTLFRSARGRPARPTTHRAKAETPIRPTAAASLRLKHLRLLTQGRPGRRPGLPAVEPGCFALRSTRAREATGVLGKRAGILIAATALAGCAADMGQAPAFERGEDIAARQCSACHAVTLTDTSTDPRAPHLRDLYKRYAIEDLRRAFL